MDPGSGGTALEVAAGQRHLHDNCGCPEHPAHQDPGDQLINKLIGGREEETAGQRLQVVDQKD